MSGLEDDTIIFLKSKDEEMFQLPYKAAKLSELVCESVDDDDQTMSVPRVSSRCLEKIVEFLKHHVEEPMEPIPLPLGASSFEEIVKPQWYQNFLEGLERETIFDLLTAANFMVIKKLLDLCCLKVTFELTGKNAEEIRQILNLPRLTPEEEARAREEHKWVFNEPEES